MKDVSDNRRQGVLREEKNVFLIERAWEAEILKTMFQALCLITFNHMFQDIDKREAGLPGSENCQLTFSKTC